MKNICCIIFLSILNLSFAQKNNQENTLLILEKISEKIASSQKEVTDFKLKVDKTSVLNHKNYGVKVPKHSNLDDQQLAELNQQIKQLTDLSSQNEFSYQRTYDFNIVDTEPILLNYQHQNLDGVNYDQELAGLLNNSMKTKVFDIFCTIKFYSDVQLKNQLIDETHKYCVELNLDELRKHTQLKTKNYFAREPKYLKKTKNYWYQLETLPNTPHQKITFKAIKDRADFSNGYLVFDAQTYDLIEVYTEEESSFSANCPISTSLISYEKQSNGTFLPTHLKFTLCDGFNYKNNKLTFKSTKESTHPKEKFSIKQSGSYHIKKQIDMKLQYGAIQKEIVDKL